MIIRNITLNNIRSYTAPAPIGLTTGVTLFEGDVGCGKSTILTAIEFALFGLGEIDGSYLLRHGEKTGSVLLDFSVNSRDYTVYRSLERKRTSISQKEGYLVEDGVRTDYSVTEMKSRVLEVLNFNENPRPKTSSLIYRYAIFTPQEMMKEVLFQPVERRLETLRRAFRIEDYSIIINNSSILLSRLESESKVLEAQASDLGQKRELLKQEKENLTSCQETLEAIDANLNSLREQRAQVAGEIEKLQAKKEHVLRLQVEIPSVEKEIRQLSGSLEENVRRKEQIKQELADISKAEETISEISPLYEEYATKTSALEELEPSIREIQELSSRQSSLLTAISKEKQHISKQIKDLEQEINDEQQRIGSEKEKVQKIPVLEEEDAELSEIAQALDELSNVLITLNQSISATKQNIQNKKERLQEVKAELSEIKKIGIGAPCPKCKQELTKSHFTKVEDGYLKEIGDIENAISGLTQNVTSQELQIAEISAKQKKAKQAEKRLGVVRQELVRLKQQEERIAEDEGKLAQRASTLETSKLLLQQEGYAQSERTELASILQKLDQLKPVQTNYDSIKQRLKELDRAKVKEQYVSTKEKIKRKSQFASEMEEKDGKIQSLNSELSSAQDAMRTKKQEFEKEKGVLQIIQGLEAKRDGLNRQCEEINGKYISKQKDIDRCNEEIGRIQLEISGKEAKLQKNDELVEIKRWLSEYFMPAVKLIETNVLSSINREFNSLFQKWLNQLLETGDIMVRVDENFTPLVEQNGYEMEVGSLSGGEKTSVALAYRLALNVMVKKVCEAMQSNLLILDEPTDGFSREQLFRLRDILDELKCEQVITVSHESELEGFVDRIYKIVKEGGISRIIT